MGWGAYSSRGGVIVSAVVLQVLSSTCIGLRFYTRFWKRQTILVPDWLVLAAFVCATALSVMEIYGVVSHGFATPLDSTNPALQGKSERLAMIQHMEYAFVLIGVFSIGLVKLSVSLLYWHLFSKVKFRRFLAVWIILLIAWTITFVLAELLECGTHPLKIFSTAKDVAHYCPHIHEIGYALVGSDVGTDLITVLIPLPLVLQMRLPLARKLLVAATFMLGLLAVGASTAKAYMFIAGVLSLTSTDGAILVTAYSMWNLAEVHVSIIAACGMTLRPILGHMLPTQRFADLFRSWGWSSEDSQQQPALPSFVQEVPGGSGRNFWNSDNTASNGTGRDTEQQNVQFQTSALAEVR
ncbi:hypothetical protein K491DRAFT_674322 [Lophiostoma macrostomum CBS 122681]|uniref:Rhodopsin domain-containing protein n=1 Tax=Lophiostoma macrostomum CBS 122681 TaxID=1314788 RepID=A0A6A6TQ38_9PLEO|nr:hypothetical protein K491DRAFT_674322 [Lophiostoma macrostomum CBS 122681]